MVNNGYVLPTVGPLYVSYLISRQVDDFASRKIEGVGPCEAFCIAFCVAAVTIIIVVATDATNPHPSSQFVV